MNRSILLKSISILLSALLFSCANNTESNSEGSKLGEKLPVSKKELRIVSLNGTFTETISAIGLEDNLVGVDITSVFPESVKELPNLGHITGVKAEGIAALNPDIVFVRKEELKADLKDQIMSLGINIVAIDQEFSVEGSKEMIRSISDTLGKPEEAAKLIEKLEANFAKVKPVENAPVVLFIYARGPGTLMVAGKGTPLQSIINLAGGKNIDLDFEDFKPLTSEAVVQANPDAILLFSSGKASLEHSIGLMAVPGIAETNAGKTQNFIGMDGLFLAGFGPRLGRAVLELNQKLSEIKK